MMQLLPQVMIGLQEHLRERPFLWFRMALDGQQMDLSFIAFRKQYRPFQFPLRQKVPNRDNDNPRPAACRSGLDRQHRAIAFLCYPVRRNTPEYRPAPPAILLADDDEIRFYHRRAFDDHPLYRTPLQDMRLYRDAP